MVGTRTFTLRASPLYLREDGANVPFSQGQLRMV